MMLRTKDGKTTAIDFREMAPEQATRDMFLDDRGNPDGKNRSPRIWPPVRRAAWRASLAWKIRHHAAEQSDPPGNQAGGRGLYC